MASFITDWVWALYVPLGMLLLLMVMIYFHRHHWLKYVYLVSASCLLIEIFSLLYLQWQCHRCQLFRLLSFSCVCPLMGLV